MIREPRFTDDVAALPTHKFGPGSLTWWGIIGYMVVEGSAFAMALAAYFFLMGNEQGWPPEGRAAPNVLAGTLFTILILLSEIPNTILKKAAKEGDVPVIRKLLPVMVGVGVPPADPARVRIQQPQLPLDRQCLCLDSVGAAAPPHHAHSHRLDRHDRTLGADAHAARLRRPAARRY